MSIAWDLRRAVVVNLPWLRARVCLLARCPPPISRWPRRTPFRYRPIILVPLSLPKSNFPHGSLPPLFCPSLRLSAPLSPYFPLLPQSHPFLRLPAPPRLSSLSLSHLRLPSSSHKPLTRCQSQNHRPSRPSPSSPSPHPAKRRQQRTSASKPYASCAPPMRSSACSPWA